MTDQILVAVLPGGVRGLASMAMSEADLERFIEEAGRMGASGWYLAEDEGNWPSLREGEI